VSNAIDPLNVRLPGETAQELLMVSPKNRNVVRHPGMA
jgi:hypothetical protein